MPSIDQFHVGDVVNVPGGMYGTVRYLGSVAGKPGRFAGIELAPEHMERGKNSGDVDGKRYFRTTMPGSGIFVPVNTANRYITKRAPGGNGGNGSLTPPARSATVSFSRSVGPGSTPTMATATGAARTRPRQPSLPPEGLTTTTSAFSASSSSASPAPPRLGLRTPSVGSSRAAAASPVGSFVSRSRSPTKTPSRPAVARPLSSLSAAERPETPTSMRMRMATVDSSRGGPTTMELQEQIKGLERQLLERDGQLNEQANALLEFQRTMEELEVPDSNTALMRAQLREKNDRLARLTLDYDNNRTDFRNARDTLETAAREAEKIYEARIEELVGQNNELMAHGDDVEIVARQLKQLEELVSELEEGLEDARRGEAEARAENEFLRGEVERTKLELERERGGSSSGFKDTKGTVDAGPRQSKQDDEIRGLKAIITSLSRGETTAASDVLQNGSPPYNPEHGQGAVQRDSESKSRRIQELEEQLQQLQLKDQRRPAIPAASPRKVSLNKLSGRIPTAANDAIISHHLSDQTVVPTKKWDDGLAITSPSGEPLSLSGKSDDDGSSLFCELCEKSGHDILNCTSMFGTHAAPNPPTGMRPPAGAEKAPNDHSNGVGYPGVVGGAGTGRQTDQDGGGIGGMRGMLNSMAPVAGKASGIIDDSKWCALCERDGHESIDCPFDE